MENTENSKKIDRRIIKTKRAICNAFTELLGEKDMNEITIKDIADMADINRKTVYNYYRGIYDIIDEIENKIVGMFEKVISNVTLDNGLENLYSIFDSLNAVMNENMDFYSRLLRINANAKLAEKLVNILKTRLKTTLEETKIFAENKVDLVVTYVVTGMIALYQEWFNSNKSQSLEEFSDDVRKLVLCGIGVFQIEK